MIAVGVVVGCKGTTGGTKKKPSTDWMPTISESHKIVDGGKWIQLAKHTDSNELPQMLMTRSILQLAS